MRLFIFVLLQVLLILPYSSLAANPETAPPLQDNKKTEVTAAQKADIKDSYGKLPLYFIENMGQVDEAVKFYERGAGHATFFTSDGVVIALTRSDNSVAGAAERGGLKENKDRKRTTEAVTLSFVGVKKNARITSDEKKIGHVSYFIGNDKSEWRTNIPTYGAVTYEEVYKNIDVKFYGNNKYIEHDVIVRPGGDPSQVKFAYKGVKGLKITEEGDLEVRLENGKIIGKKPYIYQEVNGERVAIDGSYTLLKEKDEAFTYGFTVASYDPTKDLVIDPVLVYSTYLGGSDWDIGRGIAVDSAGAAYITGETLSTDFPLVNAIQGAPGGISTYDTFITKINPAGTAIVYSTYLGGGDSDFGAAIATDNSGAVYLTGQSWSTDFPLVNPIQVPFGGGLYDAFITKINPTGSVIVYSTYLGGSGSDRGKGIAVDSAGAAYVTGFTGSTDFPLMNPIQAAKGGGSFDAFVTKINSGGTAYVYSTYLGGSKDDFGVAIALDATGAAYITGDSASPDFPLMNPIQSVYGGGFTDAFVMKINSGGTAYTYSTYLGGIAQDRSNGIAVDNTGAAYVAGYTDSDDFPLMVPIQAGMGGGAWDVFVTKLNPAGSAYVYSTYLGGNNTDFGYAIAVNNSGSAFVTGETFSTDFPLVNPVQATHGAGVFDAFVTKLNARGTAYAFSTYLGGATNDDRGHGIAVDSTGEAYVTGFAGSSDFPLVNPVQGTWMGNSDAFISKIGAAVPVVTITVVPDVVIVAQGATLGYTVTATNTTVSRQCFSYWENVNLPDGAVFPVKGELFGPLRLCLNAGASKTAHLTHGVPVSAPVGAYVFNAYDGIHPIRFRDVVDEDHFNFDVTALGPATKNPERSWRLIENGFRK